MKRVEKVEIWWIRTKKHIGVDSSERLSYFQVNKKIIEYKNCNYMRKNIRTSHNWMK